MYKIIFLPLLTMASINAMEGGNLLDEGEAPRSSVRNNQDEDILKAARKDQLNTGNNYDAALKDIRSKKEELNKKGASPDEINEAAHWIAFGYWRNLAPTFVDIYEQSKVRGGSKPRSLQNVDREIQREIDLLPQTTGKSLNMHALHHILFQYYPDDFANFMKKYDQFRTWSY